MMMPDRVIHSLNGPRGSFLISMSIITLAHAAQCLPVVRNTLPFGLRFLNEAVPLTIYAGIWLLTSISCWLAAFVTPQRKVRAGLDIMSFSLLAGLFSAWGSTYVIGWFVDSDPDPTRLILASLYFGVAGGVAAAARMVNPVRKRRGGYRVYST